MTNVQVGSKGDDNQAAGVNYGTMIKDIVLQIQQEKLYTLQKFQVPRAVGDFVGRGEYITKIEESLLADETVAISAVAGMGGVGKSTLAFYVAHKLAKAEDVAQLYVDLQGTNGALARKPREVIQDFLNTFGLEASQIVAMSDTAKQDLYRSVLVSLNAVLVLDNAQNAAQVEPLLPGKNCRVLVTSRESLGLNGVRSLRLEIMELGEALELLLVVSDRHNLTAADQLIAADIVRLCGQLPLALRISGAILQKRPNWSWVKLQDSLQDERERLEKFAELHRIVNPAQDLDVKSSFAVSYSLLEPQEQQILNRVAAIPGQDFGLLVAKAITENEAVEDCLDRLCDLQLLEGQENERYRFHDLVRLFGRENLTELIGVDGCQKIGWWALSWYVVTADYADDCFIRQLSDEKVLTSQLSDETKNRLLNNSRGWFESEWENLKGLVKWAEVEKQWSETTILPQVLKNFASLQGHQAEMPSLLSMALNAAGQNEDRLGEANTLRAIGDVQQFLAQRTAALENYQQVIEIYRQVGDRLGEANTLQAIGDVQQFLKQSTAALENYQQAIEIYRQVGARLGEANTLRVIGDVQQFLKQSTAALENYQQAIEIYRQVGDRLGEANTLKAIGDVQQFLKQSTAALENYQQAIEIYRQVGDRLGEANTLQAIGDVQQFLDQRTAALENYQQAIEIYRQVGDRLGEANTLFEIGRVQQFLAQRTAALENYQQAIEIYRQVGDRLGEANTLVEIGRVQQFLKQSTAALENYQQAIEIYRQVGDRLGEANTLKAIGDVQQFLKQSTAALENYQQAIEIYRQVGDRLGEANTLVEIGRVQQFLKQSTAALENYQQAIEIYRQVGARLGEANTLKELGALCAAENDHEQALTYYQQSTEISHQIQDNYTEGAVYCYIGRTLAKLDRTAEAIVAYQKSIELFTAINMPDLCEEMELELRSIQ
jgi:tetratricopeptide (TPR) repeat protein